MLLWLIFGSHLSLLNGGILIGIERLRRCITLAWKGGVRLRVWGSTAALLQHHICLHGACFTNAEVLPDCSAGSIGITGKFGSNQAVGLRS